MSKNLTDVAEDRRLQGDALGVYLSLADSLLSMSRPFYGLKAAASDLASTSLSAWDKECVLFALHDLKAREDAACEASHQEPSAAA